MTLVSVRIAELLNRLEQGQLELEGFISQCRQIVTEVARMERSDPEASRGAADQWVTYLHGLDHAGD